MNSGQTCITTLFLNIPNSSTPPSRSVKNNFCTSKRSFHGNFVRSSYCFKTNIFSHETSLHEDHLENYSSSTYLTVFRRCIFALLICTLSRVTFTYGLELLKLRRLIILQQHKQVVLHCTLPCIGQIRQRWIETSN